MKTRAEILEIQKKDTYILTLTKEQARIIGFALTTEIEKYDECIKKNQDYLRTVGNEGIDHIKNANEFLLDNRAELIKLRDELKYFYGWLVD